MNKAKRQLLDKTFNTFMNVGLGQENLDLLKDIVAKDVVGFGTAIDEKIFGLKELFELLKRQKEQSAGMEVSWKINTLDIHISNDENTAIFTNDLKFYITVDGNPIDMYMRISVVLEYTEAKWLVVHWHGSKPELVESKKDTWGIETWKEKAEALEKEVAERTADLVEKNWELKVEAALERVRAVTMGMKKPEDLLEVCRVISDQLVEFEVKKIRNVQIAIIDEIIGQYLCYQYFTPYKKTAVEKTEYLKSPVEHEMVRQMLASRDGYFIGRLSGNELEEFREHRKAENHLPDPFLDEAAELAYCFLSIGEGGLGLTLYQPMEEEILALFRRFHQVFLLAYQRFRDIQKAETQAREAQIELALERVRAKAMAMQDPTHFEEVIKVMGEQFIQLDFDIEWVNFGANGLDVSNGIDTWNFAVIPGGNPISSRFFIPYIDHSLFLEAVGQLDNYRRTGNDFFEISCGKEDKDLWLDHLFTTTIFKNISEEFKAIQYAKPGYTTSNIALKDTWLSIGKFDKRSFTNEQHVILRKFANAFGQAYTRFLDLQKAEAQAKEAQIETSLERVRSAALAMHRSDDLRISLQKLFEELDKLELGMIRCGIAILDPSKPSADVWIMAKSGDNNSIQLSGDNNSIQLSGNEPLESNFMLLKAYQAWKKGNDYEYILEGSELTEYYHSLDKINFLSNLKSTFSEEIKTPRQHYFNAAFKHGSLFAFFEDQMPDYGKTILKRFSNVLNLAYSRFSDIQIAEAQAREAQIEAALERVRSRSMAMHKSEELLDVISVVSEQLKQLNFKFVHVSFANNDSTQDYKFWTSARGKSKPLRFNVPYLDIAVFNNLREAQEKSVTFYTDILTKEEHIQWHKHLLNHGGANVFSKEENEFIMSRGMARSIAINPNIILILANYAMIPYSDEENKIIERFGLVFEQSYTRFLDLQKAETQTREAKIEGALEKVRSRTMGMQSSDELPEVANLLFTEVRALGIHAWSCGYNILADDKKSATACMSSEGMMQTPFQLRLWGEASFDEMGDFISSEKNMLVQELVGRALEKHYTYMKSFPDLKATFDEIERQGLSLPTFQINHLCKFTGGFILFITYEKVPDAHEIFKRFTNVFDQTYTRFLDLKQAEAQAIEATKQSSLDRVRGEISTMRNANDLDKITPLVFNELTTLGIPFIRCGVFIVHEKEKNVEIYLSTPKGKSLAVMNLPFDANEMTAQSVEAWKKEKVYIHHWDQADFVNFGKSLQEQGYITNLQIYQGSEMPPESLHLHFVPFIQGLLYVGSPETLAKEQIDMVKALAKAFSMAYARYEDFVKLEQAKAEVEMAMSELEATQSQLVQQEKLASLGQLTAGIAHEIQNPLNFVNNFSEVSVELLEEIKETVAKTRPGNGQEQGISDMTLISEILEDIKQNLEKITLHGKRADAIVKGMLEHSRSNSGAKVSTDINVLADEYLRLSYHGMKAKDKNFKAEFKTDFDPNLPKVHVVPQDIGRVLLNIINNAFYACSKLDSRVTSINSYSDNNQTDWEPALVTASTKNLGDRIEISITDNGPGIPDEIKDKIFQPFFTTKPTGQGTGLGLSLSYDIVKAHGGELKVETKEGEGSIFSIHIPINIK